MESAIYLALLAFLPLLFFLTSWNNRSSKRYPPGSLGMPIIGHNFQILRAMSANTFEEWLQQRVQKYGPISKFNFLGTPTVFLHGPAAHKFIFTADETTLSNKQPSLKQLLGKRNLLELSGEDHKRWRGAISSFLNPEALRQYVGKMDDEVKIHLKEHWHHKQEVLVMPLMNTLTFNVICTVLFGIERGRRRDRLQHLFGQLIAGFVAIPINLPFTRFNRCLRASSKARGIIMELMQEKREKLEKQDISDRPDLITRLLSMRDEAGSPLLSDEEIVDNCVGLMIAGHDTTSILLTFMLKLLAENPHVYETILNEQEEVARGKVPGELLSWEDLNKMKYTWRTASEALRMYTPVTMSFRNALKDIEIGGYIIPKGWKVMWSGTLTHRDESVFSDPYKFNPSRHENQGAIPAYSYVPFGGGPRMCPGIEFARTEALTLIHYLVTGFQWKLSLKENIMSRDPMPVFKQGLPIQIEIKKPHHDAM